MLTYNGLLRRNALVASIRNHLKAREIDVEAYRVAWEGTDVEAFHACVPCSWRLERVNSLWRVHAVTAAGEEIPVALPGPLEVERGGIQQTRELARLYALRHQLEEALTGFELLDKDRNPEFVDDHATVRALLFSDL